MKNFINLYIHILAMSRPLKNKNKTKQGGLNEKKTQRSVRANQIFIFWELELGTSVQWLYRGS